MRWATLRREPGVEVVDAEHIVAALQDRLAQVRADEPGPAGDQHAFLAQSSLSRRAGRKRSPMAASTYLFRCGPHAIRRKVRRSAGRVGSAGASGRHGAVRRLRARRRGRLRGRRGASRDPPGGIPCPASRASRYSPARRPMSSEGIASVVRAGTMWLGGLQVVVSDDRHVARHRDAAPGFRSARHRP